MRINKEQLDALVAMPDDALWREILKIAGGYGLKLPEATPSHESLERLRDTVRGDRINYGDALRMLNNYRKGK